MRKKYRKEIDKIKNQMMDSILTDSRVMVSICCMPYFPFHYTLTFIVQDYSDILRHNAVTLHNPEIYTIHVWGWRYPSIPFELMTPLDTMEFIKEHLE